MQTIGRVISIDAVDKYTIILTPEVRLKRYEYVYHISNNRKVIGYIEDIRSKSSLPSELPWEIASRMPLDKDTSVVMATVRMIENGDPPSIGEWIYLASDYDIERIYAVPPHRAIHIGHLASRPNVKIHLDLNALSRHLAIIAATGSGKTWTTVVLIEELLRKGATILILDPHGEYTKIKENVDKVGGNAIILKAHSGQEGDISYTIDLTQVDADELAFVMGIPKQASRLRSTLVNLRTLVEELYSETKDRNVFSLKNMKDLLLTIAEAAETASSYAQFEAILKSKNISHKNSLKRFWNILRKSVDPAYDLVKYIDELDRLGVYSTKPTPIAAFLRPMTATIFNLSGIKLEVQTHLVYNILKRTFNARVRYLRDLKGEKYPYPVEIVVEEAHRFAPPPQEGSTWTSQLLRRIATEGRKFGVFLTVITQRPSRVDPTVLSQCQSQVIMRIVNPKDQQAVIDSSEELGARLASDLPSLRPGEAIIVGPIIKKPAFVKVRDRVLSYGGGDIDVSIEWSKALLQLDELKDVDLIIESNKYTISKILGISLGRELLERAKSILLSEMVYVDGDLNVVFNECKVNLLTFKSTCDDESYIVAAIVEGVRRGVFNPSKLIKEADH